MTKETVQNLERLKKHNLFVGEEPRTSLNELGCSMFYAKLKLGIESGDVIIPVLLDTSKSFYLLHGTGLYAAKQIIREELIKPSSGKNDLIDKGKLFLTNDFEYAKLYGGREVILEQSDNEPRYIVFEVDIKGYEIYCLEKPKEKQSLQVQFMMSGREHRMQEFCTYQPIHTKDIANIYCMSVETERKEEITLITAEELLSL